MKLNSKSVLSSPATVSKQHSTLSKESFYCIRQSWFDIVAGLDRA